MEEQEGIKTMLLGGLRTTLVMEEGKTLEEATIKKAVESKGLAFVSLETVKRPTPQAVFRVEAKGLG